MHELVMMAVLGALAGSTIAYALHLARLILMERNNKGDTQ